MREAKALAHGQPAPALGQGPSKLRGQFGGAARPLCASFAVNQADVLHSSQAATISQRGRQLSAFGLRPASGPAWQAWAGKASNIF